MIDQKRASASLVKKTAHDLRVLVAKCEPEGLLGFEGDLLARLGVSRPTLRQAAALVAQEQLLTVKRGGGGGYFARIPTSSGVAHTAAIYLRAHKSGLQELVQAIEPNTTELTRLAARNRTEADICALKVFLAKEQNVDEPALTRTDFLRSLDECSRLIGAISRNRVLSLILEILHDSLVLHVAEIEAWLASPERVSRYRMARLLMCNAVISGDEEVAVLMASRGTREFTVWVLQGLADTNGSPQ